MPCPEKDVLLDQRTKIGFFSDFDVLGIVCSKNQETRQKFHLLQGKVTEWVCQ